jgi:CBS domain-containing protein
MQIPSEWEEAYLDEASFRASILQEPLSALSLRAPVCIVPDTLVGDAVRIMNDARIGALLVTSRDGRLSGIFTERDVLKRVVGGGIPKEASVLEVMTPEPCCLHRDDAVVFALKLMHEGGFRHVPLVDDEHRPVAVVSVKDVVELVVDLLEKEIATAPPEPRHLAPATSEGA